MSTPELLTAALAPPSPSTWAVSRSPLDHTLENPSALSMRDLAITAQSRQTARIMIVDDEPINVKVARKFLEQGGYQHFLTSTDAREVIGLVQKELPDVLLLDIHMPHISGLDILRAIHFDQRLQHIPVLILTASTENTTKLEALKYGATDFLSKPVDPAELGLRVRNALVAKAHHDHMAVYSEHLEQQVQRRTAQVEASRLDVINCLARAAEYRDGDTGEHVIRVGAYVRIVSEELGQSEQFIQTIEQAAKLHDVGKIGICDSILLKPASLEPHEFELMKKHCVYGRDIILGTRWHGSDTVAQSTGQQALTVQENDAGGCPLLGMAAVIAMTHHEKWDGSGYPLGLAGEQIPIEGRITAIADVFDALSNPRPYKSAFPLDQCFQMIETGRGTHFDPAVVDAVMVREAEFRAVYEQYSVVGSSGPPGP